MRDFTYYNSQDKFDLHISASGWLIDIGLRETRWILDAKWLIKHTTFHAWIRN